jgi:DNA-binding beta-propeller fold protein YncE
MQKPVTASLALIALALPAAATSHRPRLELLPLGTHASGIFAEGGAEIVSYDPRTRRAFVVNAQDVSVDVLDLADPAHPAPIHTIDVSPFGGSANSVDVARGILAVAVEADEKTDPGLVAFFSTEDYRLLGTARVGALPDMLTFTPGGQTLLVANEGEPSSYGKADSVDPEGSVSIVDLRRGCDRAHVRTAHFRRFNARKDELVAAGVRIFGPGASVAQDLEPEYVAVAGDRAYVTLQENNALAVVDIDRASVLEILPLGEKDHARRGQGLDASDREISSSQGAIHIERWPVRGLYMPDAIASYRFFGHTFLVTANEGDARNYDGFAEEVRVGASSYLLDPTAFPDAAALKASAALGRLTVTTSSGDTDGDGDFDEIHAFGARSFSIWHAASGHQVFDSGDRLERITARELPGNFNSDHEANNFDNRSDNKGPEPEGLALGTIHGRTYAFLGLERVGGVMVFDVTNPWNVSFETYLNNRDFSGDPESGTAGDLGPEGLHFVPAVQSPTRRPLLIVGNEVSGTTTVYEVRLD